MNNTVVLIPTRDCNTRVQWAQDIAIDYKHGFSNVPVKL